VSAPLPWPAGLTGTPATAVIDRAIERGRLAHSILLHADDPAILSEIAGAIADRLLNTAGAADSRDGWHGAFAGGSSHPDCFVLRPAGKMRLIAAEATRELIAKVQVSASVADRKVAIIHEADRMNSAAANIFLKTLEEPPANTTLLLLTTHPYALLPTIRSRCLHFRFPAGAAGALPVADGWKEWLVDYKSWLGQATLPAEGKRGVADHIFTIYGLIARFGMVLERATAAAWEKEKAVLPEELEEAEQVAIETGLANGLRSRLFADVEVATRDFAREKLLAGESSMRYSLGAAVQELESSTRLLRLNLNESAALENFLLGSLRIWARR
jgi:DNA polymerase-3 subunit delta'